MKKLFCGKGFTVARQMHSNEACKIQATLEHAFKNALFWA